VDVKVALFADVVASLLLHISIAVGEHLSLSPFVSDSRACRGSLHEFLCIMMALYGHFFQASCSEHMWTCCLFSKMLYKRDHSEFGREKQASSGRTRSIFLQSLLAKRSRFRRDTVPGAAEQPQAITAR
jgi:hypothetical protein